MVVRFIDIPTDIKLHFLQYEGSLIKKHVSKQKGISIWNFDTISFIRRDGDCIHALGLNGQIRTFIILKYNPK
jgi:hypothetical protein